LPIPFFTDQNVPDSVGLALIQAGHDVVRLRDVMDVTTVDPVIAAACAQNGHVLISHDGDFKQIAKRLLITQRDYRTLLHRIQMRCPEPDSAARIIDALPLIEFEWARLVVGKPLVIDIAAACIRVWR
jgi:predicted nuclease of predicted toxin-antitoxin system